MKKIKEDKEFILRHNGISITCSDKNKKKLTKIWPKVQKIIDKSMQEASDEIYYQLIYGD